MNEINLTISLISSAVMLIIVAGCYNIKSFTTRSGKQAIHIFESFLLFSAANIPLAAGVITNRFVYVASVLVIFFLLFAVSFHLFAYVHTYFPLPEEIHRKIFLIINLVCALGIAFILIGLFRSFQGGDHRVFLFCSEMCMMVIMITTIISVIRYKKYLRRNNLIVFSLYTTIAVAFIILQGFFREVHLLETGLLFTCVIIYAVLFVRNHIQLSVEREKLSDMRMRLLQSRMNPHFLSNTMNTIYHLCEKEPEKAMQGINALSGFLRSNMDFTSSESLIPFEKELENVKYYCSLEQLRFGKQIRVMYMIETTDFKVPPFSLQVFVENAIQHGYTGNTPEVISIVTRKLPDKTELSITDNGKGFDPEKVKTETVHYGITSAKQRLEELLGAEVQVNSSENQGTVVLIDIPLERQEN